MKHRILLTLLASLYALSSLANGTKIDGIHYILNDNNMTASVTYTGSELSLNDDNPYIGEITIPSIVSITYMENNIVHYKYYSVTSIGRYAFLGCSDLTNVSIPNSVTSILWEAFWGCTGLTNINIPNSVTSIGGGAFMNCTSLTNINIPNSVTSIDQDAFSYCTGLTSINIPNSVTSIGKQAFQGCNGLTSITIPNSVTSIGSAVFNYCI